MIQLEMKFNMIKYLAIIQFNEIINSKLKFGDRYMGAISQAIKSFPEVDDIQI